MLNFTDVKYRLVQQDAEGILQHPGCCCNCWYNLTKPLATQILGLITYIFIFHSVKFTWDTEEHKLYLLRCQFWKPEANYKYFNIPVGVSEVFGLSLELTKLSLQFSLELISWFWQKWQNLWFVMVTLETPSWTCLNCFVSLANLWLKRSGLTLKKDKNRSHFKVL